MDAAGISTLFLRTRVLVTHSQYEPGGRVLLEALSASIPVIATENGFAKDLIKDKYNGFLVEYGQVTDLYTVMKYCMNQPDALTTMKKNARETYLGCHRKWTCYKKQIQIYTDLGMTCFKKDLS